jgi:pyruvate,water dikinase
LFLAAGAVVVETGSVVSHAAIVSRELGIPAAVSVADATRRIQNGTIITVDGNTGMVTVH